MAITAEENTHADTMLSRAAKTGSRLVTEEKDKTFETHVKPTSVRTLYNYSNIFYYYV